MKSNYAEAWFNRACLYSVLKNKEEALSNLKKAIELAIDLKKIARKDGAFKDLWEDEDFKKLTE